MNECIQMYSNIISKSNFNHWLKKPLTFHDFTYNFL